MQNITIIGGSSGFGEWSARFIKKHFPESIHITITGTDKQRTKNAAEKIGCHFSTDNISAVQDADIVIFAVPISLTQQVIEKIGPHIKSGAIVADVTSIKQFPAQAMKQSVANDVLVIPTHPMFGPYISSIAGQIFVLTPEEKDKKDARYIFLTQFLKAQGAKVIEATPQEHDKMMAVVQGLTHYNMFVLGETLKRLEIDIEKSMNFVSPIYKIMISSVARYMSHNPKLYGDIQMYNPEVLEVHKAFMETTNDFNGFVKNKDEESFVNTILETQKYFGDNAQKGQNYTDKIIYLISKQIEKVKNNIGKQITLVNIYSGEQIEGIIKKFENNQIWLENNTQYPIDNWEIL